MHIDISRCVYKNPLFLGTYLVKLPSPSNDQAVCLRIEDDRLIVSARGPYGEMYQETVEGVGSPDRHGRPGSGHLGRVGLPSIVLRSRKPWTRPSVWRTATGAACRVAGWSNAAQVSMDSRAAWTGYFRTSGLIIRLVIGANPNLTVILAPRSRCRFTTTPKPRPPY
jgi:hypothetical protein